MTYSFRSKSRSSANVWYRRQPGIQHPRLLGIRQAIQAGKQVVDALLPFVAAVSGSMAAAATIWLGVGRGGRSFSCS